MYNFTQIAIEMNEMEDNLAPTDCRFRPDQRLMEETKWNEADEKKVYIEDKQRLRLNQPTFTVESIWFRKSLDAYTNETRYVFTDEYWDCKAKQDWSKCPHLFD